MKVYSDFGKTAKKLLNDDFVSGKKVEVKTSTEDGVKFTAAGVESAKDGSVSGSLSWKYKVYGNAFTTKVLTSNTVSTEGVFEKLGVEGLKATLNGAYGADKYAATTKIEYAKDPVSLVAFVDVPSKLLMPSISVAYKNVSVGGEALFSQEEKNVTKYGMGATVVHKDSEATLSVSDKLKTLKVAFSHSVSPSFAVAAEASYNRDAKASSMVGGIKHVHESTTTKLKCNDQGLVSLSYSTKVDKNMTITMSSSTNVKEFEKGHKFGVSLSVEQP